MTHASTDPYAIDPARDKCIGTRRWIEMVGVLHRLGYGRLRLACSWENAGPAPVWFGVVAPGSCFHREHGAILARPRFDENERAIWEAVLHDGEPMFNSRFEAPNDTGDDGYEAKGGPAFGAGILGYGFLLDVAGKDVSVLSRVY